MSELANFAEEPDYDDNPAIFPGGLLGDGEGMTVTIAGEAETFNSDQHGPGFRQPIVFHEADQTPTWAEDPEDEGEPIAPDTRADLVSWSKRLARAILAAGDGDALGLVGDTVTITKTGDGLQTEWTVDVLESADD